MKTVHVETPYVGLVPYTEDDARFFFGREKDQQIIIANLFASKLTILYGSSGVGKSSILRAGVVRELNERSAKMVAEQGTPDIVVAYFKDWKTNPLNGLKLAIISALNAAGLYLDADMGQSLAQLLGNSALRLDADFMIILDQFEDYFLYHTRELEPRTFAYEFSEAANNPGLPVSFLVSLRDDSLSKLDRFKTLLPNLFSNYLRVHPLNRLEAQRAIVLPVEAYSRMPDDERTYHGTITMQPELVEQILDEVRQDRLLIGEGGRGVVSATASTGIEAPYLQLVLRKVWAEELGSGSQQLRLQTLNKLGGAKEIVGKHLEEVLDRFTENEKEVCSRMFEFLVTPGGAKIAHTVSDLADFAEADQNLLEPILEKLSGPDTRILSPVASMEVETPTRYEIYHDSLAHAILEWRKSYVARREREEQERVRAEEAAQQKKELDHATALAAAQRGRAEAQARSARRLQWMIGILGGFLILVVLAAAYAWNQRRTAIQNEELARNSEQLARDSALDAQQARAEAARAAAELAKTLGSKDEVEKWSALAADAQAQARALAAKGATALDRLTEAQQAVKQLNQQLTQARAESNRLRVAAQEGKRTASAVPTTTKLADTINRPTVPRLVGTTLTETTNWFAGITNLRVGRITERPSDRPAGVILQQTPAAGSTVEQGTAVNLVIAGPVSPRAPAEVRLSLTLTGIYPVQSGRSTRWRFSVLAREDSAGQEREILSIPQADYRNTASQPRSLRRQARIVSREGNTVRLRIRGDSQAEVAAEGQFSIFVKPMSGWSSAETFRVPVISWQEPSKGSFVLVFDVFPESSVSTR